MLTKTPASRVFPALLAGVAALLFGGLYAAKWQMLKTRADIAAPIHVAPNGVDVGLYTRRLETQRAMLRAVKSGQTRAVRPLLDSGVPVDLRIGEGRTPLAYASEYGHLELVRFLLSRGADGNARTAYGGSSPYAASTPYRVSDMNTQPVGGSTPLMYAAMQGHADIAAALLAHGADVNLKRAHGGTALQDAVMRHDRRVYDMLRTHGATVTLQDALMVGDIETVRALLPQGADVDKQDRDGNTLLMTAASSRSRETVQFLLDRGGDVNARSRYGATALGIAIGWRYPDVVRLLLDRGARLKPADAAQGPLTNAAGSGSVALVKLLLAHGADVRAEGARALTIARQNRYKDIALLLEQAGAQDGPGRRSAP